MTTRSPGRVTKAMSRKAARHWRLAERELEAALHHLEAAGVELLAGELATRHASVVRDLIADVSNARANVGYAAGEEERSAAR